ncbi:AraC family transcriptional regulator [Mucilaginibacter gotjawali]|uniref:AraC-like DNA-binding protein n=2 Tax=Mucilaginibacter gotjawali TaxID=1550579 RepID=A0A839SLA1_9SPHI|nr:helix-turn-helix transcriptional regulator [Mucilaginibacter gotjawali]MBB3058666.1 AraC-like DNA-binding protein [Mucilaginibacter gotjawali]BAU55865.1 Arabinose operon regulatory protein [Mucilaginibacter gotjawali]
MQSTPVFDICTLSDFKENDILISRFAPYLAQHKNLSAAHRHSFYHLVLFTTGAGTHSIDFERFFVKPYQIYFMVPGQVHSWDFEGFTDGYIINFSAAFFQSFLLNPSYPETFSFFGENVKAAVIDLPDHLHQKVAELFEKIVNEAVHEEDSAPDMIRILMLQLFITIGRITKKGIGRGPSSYNQTLLRNFQKLIGEHYTRIKLPKDYAELLYITPNHLNAVCKDLLGISAGEVIRNRMMLEAKRLLTNPQLNINEIAFMLNFSDNSYFTKFFKKFEGKTPEDFRRGILNHHKHE